VSIGTVSHECGKMTEAAIERLRSRMGEVTPIEQPYMPYANPDSITHVVRRLGDTNPMYTARGYAARTRYGRLVAPTGIFYAVA
jgi:hypothetical protein